MRMWMVDPKKMCNKHLLGEHVELHMFVGCILKGKSLQGYVDKGLLQIVDIEKRHSELVNEMKRRGMVHKSILPEYDLIVYRSVIDSKVDVDKNIIELKRRCLSCRNLLS